VEADDSEQYIDAALRFHRSLVEGSNNRTFLNVWDSLLWDIRGRIALRRMAERGRSLGSLAEMNRDLLRFLKAQDTEAAAAKVECLLEKVAASFSPE